MAERSNDWKVAIKSQDIFRDFIIRYFTQHEELTGTYDIPSYYEHYVVKLDKHDNIVISLTVGMNLAGDNVSAPLPTKEKEKMSIEDFRTLILNKKFADQNMSLADVFQTVAGVPNQNKE
ncbi:hypothetical protein LASUN_23420 [Lentilactobacillus sunkii]|jgi:hypothetical protein|uniref:Uncharacterized protein n=1 Tax=Lentilactobacillus sunkii TaxID=481719 RepID=A0A1E7X9V3_9LACO|nr:hypothetical protein [Lentilactobacillus sunkii]OFA09860.1 hypothetical protein LASUN_23420 [Lentilactobacillus sunkii]